MFICEDVTALSASKRVPDRPYCCDPALVSEREGCFAGLGGCGEGAIQSHS